MFGRSKDKPKTDPKTNINYDELGRAVEKVFVRDYINYLGSTKRQIWSSFVRGIFVGLGTVIGASVVVAILISFLSLFDTAPIIGEYIDHIVQSIEATQPTPTPTPPPSN